MSRHADQFLSDGVLTHPESRAKTARNEVLALGSKSCRSVMRLINLIPEVEDIFQGGYLESMDTNNKETSSYFI